MFAFILIILYTIILTSKFLTYKYTNSNSKYDIKLYNVIDRSVISKFHSISDIHNTDRDKYIKENKNLRIYIWSKMIELFYRNITNTQQFKDLKIFMDKSSDYNIILNNIGIILNLPPEIKNIIK